VGNGKVMRKTVIRGRGSGRRTAVYPCCLTRRDCRDEDEHILKIKGEGGEKKKLPHQKGERKRRKGDRRHEKKE